MAARLKIASMMPNRMIKTRKALLKKKNWEGRLELFSDKQIQVKMEACQKMKRTRHFGGRLVTKARRRKNPRLIGRGKGELHKKNQK